jgi:dTDP-4-dehydrorhamnose 3,5-epimerase
VRGLHVRRTLAEAKLVRCARGRVYDVVVDLRPWSPTYRRWESFVLDDVEHRHVFIPPGCAHGFQALTELADVCYHHDAVYDPDVSVAVAWDDPELAIPWPLPNPVLSDADRSAPTLAAVEQELPTWFGTTATEAS